MCMVIGILIVLGSGLFYVILSEFKDWNNGFSSSTGERWELLSTDSSGARSYKDSKDNVVWISWFDTL